MPKILKSPTLYVSVLWALILAAVLLSGCVRVPSEVVICLAPDSIATSGTQECTDEITIIDSTTTKK